MESCMLSSMLLWCYTHVCLNSIFVILENLSTLDLALSGVKGLRNERCQKSLWIKE